ncbi:MAG: DNA repair protein RecO [Bacteroidetes bacterium]|nr:DNA repair protein RecO [Bacteroidota bacterium]
MELHKTKGIVLRNVKYGDTSIIATIYTELFGVQSYLVNGVRTSSKKGQGKANMFQPAALLDLVVYHNELKNLQRIKEFRWAHLYTHIFFDVIKNAVGLFMIELLQKCLKQPEPNAELFYFIEDAFSYLDESDDAVVANYPLFFMLNLAGFFGFRISDEYNEENTILDLQQGFFVHEKTEHPYFLDGQNSFITSEILKVRKPGELSDIKLNRETRRTLLQAYMHFYALHIQDFGVMKTFQVMQTIL